MHCPAVNGAGDVSARTAGWAVVLRDFHSPGDRSNQIGWMKSAGGSLGPASEELLVLATGWLQYDKFSPLNQYHSVNKTQGFLSFSSYF